MALLASGSLRMPIASSNKDMAELGRSVHELTAAITGLPENNVMWAMFAGHLGVARLQHGVLKNDHAECLAAADLLARAADTVHEEYAWSKNLYLMGGIGQVLRGIHDNDSAALERGAKLLEKTPNGKRVTGLSSARYHGILGGIHLVLHDLDNGSRHLNGALRHLEQAHEEILKAETDSSAAAAIRKDLARARRADGRLQEAVTAGMRALHDLFDTVLLQATLDHGLTVARAAAPFSREVARWCVSDGRLTTALEALELGRGLVLHAATAATTVAEQLRDRERADLAEEWTNASVTGEGSWAFPRELEDKDLSEVVPQLIDAVFETPRPNDLRVRVLDVLRTGPSPDSRLRAPALEELRKAVSNVGSDALVYLVPCAADEPGRALLLLPHGSPISVELPDLRTEDVERAAAATSWQDEEGPSADTFGEMTEWAWVTVVRPVLAALPGDRPPRLVLVPCGALGLIPWHAARAPGGEYAVHQAVFSYASSGRQLLDVTRRDRLPLGDDPVLVADPTLELFYARHEVDFLARRYPAARRYGCPPDLDGVERAEQIDGRPEEVLAHFPSGELPGASLLHLACHAMTVSPPTQSHLKLASPHGPESSARLEVGAILRRTHALPPARPGGLVLLSACETDLTTKDYDEALTIATAFLGAGFATVIASRWKVADFRAAVLVFMFHHYLAQCLAPADALREAQLWMLDPGRRIPTGMPTCLAEDASAADAGLDDPRGWAAFTHQGR
jgi:hypothetical protein